MKIYRNWRCQELKTIKYIEEMRQNFVRISDKQKQALLKYWGKNIDEYELTEQDICEQTRKVMNNA